MEKVRDGKEPTPTEVSRISLRQQTSGGGSIPKNDNQKCTRSNVIAALCETLALKRYVSVILYYL